MTADFRNRFSSYLCPLNFFVLCSFLVFLEAGCDSRSPEKQGTGLADANDPRLPTPSVLAVQNDRMAQSNQKFLRLLPAVKIELDRWVRLNLLI